MKKYIIKDWANNDVFGGDTYKTYEDAYERLTLELTALYGDDFEDVELDEYEIREVK